jgi:hypothetical protein
MREVDTSAVTWVGGCDDEFTSLLQDGGLPKSTDRKLVREVRRNQGLPEPISFHLQVSVLPVAGEYVSQVGPQHILVSSSVLSDVAAYRRALKPAITASIRATVPTAADAPRAAPTPRGVLMANWEASYSEPRALQYALYIRDAAALTVNGRPDIPPVTQPVSLPEALPPDRDRASAAAEWECWWQELLELVKADQREKLSRWQDVRPDPAKRPNLGALSDAYQDRAQAWLTDQKGQLDAQRELHGPLGGVLEGELVDRIIRSRKRFGRIRPFELRVTGLLTESARAWRLDRNHLLISRPLRQDIDRYQDALQPLVEELM